MKTRYVVLLVAIGIVAVLLICLWPLLQMSGVETRIETVKGSQIAQDLEQMQANVGKSLARSTEVAGVVTLRKTAFPTPKSDPFIALLPVEEGTAAPEAPGAPGAMAPAGLRPPGTEAVPGPFLPQIPGSSTPLPTGPASPALSVTPTFPTPPSIPPSTPFAPGTAPTPVGTKPPAPKEEIWPVIRVHGLAISKSNSLAVIDNDVYGPDSKLDGLKVVSVSDKGVVLASELGKQRELLLEGWQQGGKAK